MEMGGHLGGGVAIRSQCNDLALAPLGDFRSSLAPGTARPRVRMVTSRFTQYSLRWTPIPNACPNSADLLPWDAVWPGCNAGGGADRAALSRR